MTDASNPGHSLNGMSVTVFPAFESRMAMRAGQATKRVGDVTVAAPFSSSSDRTSTTLTFESVYDEYFDFVWRSVRRLGVQESAQDDVVQEVFLVVYRRLSDFEHRSSVKTWLFGIALRVARTHRRGLARKGGADPLPPELVDEGAAGPEANAQQNEARRLLERLLGELDDEKRPVFVLAELEQLTAPEIAGALGLKVNTVYSRLRAARKAFDAAVKREKAKEERRS